MKLFFYVTLLFLAAYLIMDVSIISSDERPIVQLVAGISLLFMIVYNANNIKIILYVLKNNQFLFFLVVYNLNNYFLLFFILYSFPIGSAETRFS